MFVYDPTVANGNLIASITDSLTSPTGDTTLAGITSYKKGTTAHVQIINQNINLQDESGVSWTIVADTTSADLVILTPGGKKIFLTQAGFWNALDPSSSVPETWHTMSGFLNSWAATGNTPRYQLLPDGNVQIDGAMDATNATASTFFTMPAAYRPVSTTKLWASGANGGVPAGQSPFTQVATSGSIAILGVTLPTAGAHVTISGIYTLT